MTSTDLAEFLKDFLLTDSQLQQIYDSFCNEISKGLSKTKHAEADTKCYITYVQALPTGNEVGKYLALDLGGTNFRVLLVTLNGNHDAMFVSKIFTVPKDIMVGTGTNLFDYIAECLAVFVKEQNIEADHLPLGFTFSFPCVQLGLQRALLVRWTKGFAASGVESLDVGRLLKEAIVKRNELKIDVVAILNDTTGTLMSCAHRNDKCRIGVIIGTGCNACYVENVDNVEMLAPEFKKISQNIIINTEWGAFGDSGLLEFIRTDYDREIDKKTLNAGYQIFEKMISGMYLGELVRLILVKAIQKTLILKKYSTTTLAADLMKNVDCFETRYIFEIESDASENLVNIKQIITNVLKVTEVTLEDCQNLKFICDCILRRSATLVSLAISGLINRIKVQNVVVGVDGSVYRHNPNYRNYMSEVIKKFAHFNFELMLSEDGSGRGAALVAAVASKE